MAVGYKHAHTHVHSTVRAAEGYTKGTEWEGEAPSMRVGGCTYARTRVRVCGGRGTNLDKVKGCVSPTHATSLFGDRGMGRGGRERGGVGTVPLS